MTRGLLNVETDAVKAADAMLAHIEANIKKTGYLEVNHMYKLPLLPLNYPIIT